MIEKTFLLQVICLYEPDALVHFQHMKMLVKLLSTLLCTSVAAAETTTGRPRHGLIGYGINMYNPICASACGRAAPMYLYCADGVSSSGGGMSMIAINDTTNVTATESPSAECMANNIPYLQTVAYCIHERCDGSVTPPERELWWYRYVVGIMADQPAPSMTYQESLSSIPTAPNQTLPADSPLVSPVLLNQESYVAMANIMKNFQWVEGLHSRYS